jgi:hypothetical protein
MSRILSNLGLGLVAGAVGTETLNLMTYGDMALRGRGASSVPSKVAAALGADLHIKAITPENESSEAGNRRSAAGALLGYATGLSLGVIYGGLRATNFEANPLTTAIGLGIGAMAMGDVPAVVTGATNVREWGKSDWLSDIVPHIAYGLATVGAFELATHRERRRFNWLP